MLYNKKVSIHSIEKLCEECLNVKNAFNLLDINLILNVMLA